MLQKPPKIGVFSKMNDSWVLVLKNDQDTEYQIFEMPQLPTDKVLKYTKKAFMFLLKLYLFYI